MTYILDLMTCQVDFPDRRISDRQFPAGATDTSRRRSVPKTPPAPYPQAADFHKDLFIERLVLSADRVHCKITALRTSASLSRANATLNATTCEWVLTSITQTVIVFLVGRGVLAEEARFGRGRNSDAKSRGQKGNNIAAVRN